MKSMRAAIFDSSTRQLTIEDVPIPEPGPGEVLVRVKACGICLSDVHLIDGTLRSTLPKVTPGHESAGVIERVGEYVPPAWKPGQRILMPGGKPCGTCRNCLRGDANRCLETMVMGFDYNGAWAEYVVVPGAGLTEVPEHIPFEQAAILADAVATPYAGLTDRAGLRPAESIGLWGIGGLGVHAVQIARMFGAAPIIALDPNEAARRRALEFGADYALDPTAHGVEKEVWRLTDGLGLDVAVDLVGANRVLAQGNACLGRYGRLVMIGLSIEPIALGPGVAFGVKSHSMLGHLGYQKEHLDQLVKLVAAGRLDVSRSVSEVMPLEQVGRGVERLAKKEGNPIRLVVAP
jgi:D-arabinose 1-dehydrogenase-like Zn-dependent alcohol dehydrogenase